MKARKIDDEGSPEPIPGLPETLPDGETILWQGAPSFLALAVNAFHVRAVAIWFAIAALWRAAITMTAGADAIEIAAMLAPIGGFFVAALGVLLLLAMLMQRATIYTITSRRVVLRYGAAIRKTINIPFRVIEKAELKLRAGGDGDIPLALGGPDRIAYLHLWPHVRPGRYAKAEPMLRAVPDAAAVAELLGKAVKAAAPETVVGAWPASTLRQTPERIPAAVAA